MTKDVLTSIKTAAEALHLTPATVYAMIERGVLPAVRIGTRALRIRASDLEKIVAEGTHATHGTR